MRALALGVVLAGTSLVLVSISKNEPSQELHGGSTLVALEASAPAHVGSVAPATLTEVVQRYCVVCHNDGMLTGNVTFQSFDVERAAENAATAERMIRKLRAGMMPPPGLPRPGGDTLQVLVETLEARVDAAARSAPNLGDRRFARLSQAEYERVIKDLLALDVDAGQWLPPDVLMGSFDNMSGAQALSTTLVDAYLRAAIEVARLAVGNDKAVSVTAKYATPAVISQHAWDHVEGTPFGTRGGMVVDHTFPADGQYVIAVATSLGTSNNIWFEDVDVSIDGEPVALLKLAHNGGGAGGGGNGNNFQNLAASGVVTDPIFIRAGQRRISAAFVDQIDGPYEDRFKVPDASSAAGAAGTPGVTGLTKLDTLTIIGPQSVTGVSDTPSRRKIFSCRPARAAEERACAESILTRLATQAYRRPVTSENVAQLMAFYDEAAAAEGFEVGVRAGLQAILVAPQMMFRLESVPEGVEAGESFRLSDVDLANRLSFFLWASGPDEELLRVATSGRLSNDAELERQVERMLADPRAEALATRFTHQWLRLQDVGKNWPEPYFYPEFSQQLADAMVRETELFFMNLVQQDLSLLELFSADYTFLNERLAKHYGIEGVVGEDFVRVRYPTDQRRGVLGHGSILHLTSMSNRTSPVLRGKWVMEVLMGTPPPPPPPNVPAFEASPSAGAGRRLTTRERMEAHRRSPVCNSCHSFIDPIGLALDNFDATGKWRIRENMAPLDTRGTFYDGTEISQPNQLANVLLKRPIPLVRNFTGNLLAYAIGRPLEYFDQPTVRVIQRDAEANGYKMSSLIMGVVKSDPFQMKQARTTTN